MITGLESVSYDKKSSEYYAYLDLSSDLDNKSSNFIAINHLSNKEKHLARSSCSGSCTIKGISSGIRCVKKIRNSLKDCDGKIIYQHRTYR